MRWMHGMSNTKLFKVWQEMKFRCSSPNCANYKSYGGRGIKVCEEWQDFEPFYQWASTNGYQEGLTIERKDNNGNYEPENCKWATKKEQANNKRNNIIVEIDGVTHTVSEWCDITGVSRPALLNRLIYGFQGKDLIRPVRKRRKNIGSTPAANNLE